MRLIKHILFFLLASTSFVAWSQQNLVYNHYFMNPYLYNPSYIATDGYTSLYMNFRKQWVGFEGAPTTSTLNLQVPLNYRMGVGVNLYNDVAGVLQTNSGMASFAYQVFLGKSKSDFHRLGFGMAAGVTMNRINMSKVDNPNDPALSNNNTNSLDGQFGINYQYSNLKIGFALPRLFNSTIVSENGFQSPQLNPLKTTISTISYNFNINPRISFEPYFLLRTNEDIKTQYEVLGVLKIDNLVWAGAAYRLDYGPAAFLGFNMKDKLRVGYAYEIAPAQSGSFGNGSHEIQVAVRFGKGKKGQPIAKEKPIPTNVVEPAKVEEVKTEEQVVVPAEEKPIVEKPVEDKPIEEVIVVTKPVEVVKPEVEKTKVPSNDDMKPGHYLVVGTFRIKLNANKYMETLNKAGYQAEVDFSAKRGYYFVHLGNVSSLEEAKTLRDRYRKVNLFTLKDTWILSINE